MAEARPAAAEGRDIEVSQLLAAGANPNAQDDNGWTPLHFAAQSVSVGVTKALLDAGVNTELRDARGSSPLWRAVMESKGDGSVIAVLRGSG